MAQVRLDEGDEITQKPGEGSLGSIRTWFQGTFRYGPPEHCITSPIQSIRIKKMKLISRQKHSRVTNIQLRVNNSGNGILWKNENLASAQSRGARLGRIDKREAYKQAFRSCTTLLIHTLAFEKIYSPKQKSLWSPTSSTPSGKKSRGCGGW